MRPLGVVSAVFPFGRQEGTIFYCAQVAINRRHFLGVVRHRHHYGVIPQLDQLVLIRVSDAHPIQRCFPIASFNETLHDFPPAFSSILVFPSGSYASTPSKKD
jgi:hypothetical protein